MYLQCSEYRLMHSASIGRTIVQQRCVIPTYTYGVGKRLESCELWYSNLSSAYSQE